MSLTNDSRFSSSATYFVPAATQTGGSTVNSILKINPPAGSTSSSILNVATVGGALNLGSSAAFPSTLQIVEAGKGYIQTAGDAVAGTSPLTLSGGVAGAASGLINMGTNTGLETLTIGANATSSFNNIILSAGVNAATTFNKPVITNIDVDITNGGVYRRSNTSDNQAIVVPCLTTDSGATTALVVPTPDGLITGLYAVLTGGNGSLPVGVSGTGSLMYWNGAAWSAGGSMNNPQTGGAGANQINQYGIRSTGGLGANLTFCNGTGEQVIGGAVNVYIMLLLAGPFGAQLAPFS